MYRRPSFAKHSYTRSMGDLMSSATGAWEWKVSNSKKLSHIVTYGINEWCKVRWINNSVIFVNVLHFGH